MFGYRIKVTLKQRETYAAMCANYSLLQNYIMELSQDELIGCIMEEKRTRGRVNILTRLYARFSELRKTDERREMLS